MTKLHICPECKKKTLTDQELQNWGMCTHCFIYVLRDAMLAMAHDFLADQQALGWIASYTRADTSALVREYIDKQKTLKRISREEFMTMPFMTDPFCKQGPMTPEAQAFWDMHNARGGEGWYQTGTDYYYWDIANDYGEKLCPFHIWGWDLL